MKKLSKSKILKKRISKSKTSKTRSKSKLTSKKSKYLRKNPIDRKIDEKIKEKIFEKLIDFKDDKIQKTPHEKIINEFIFKKIDFKNKKIYNFPEKIIKIDFRKELSELIDEEIILHFIDYKNSSNNKKIFGLLKRGLLPDTYLLQFDPIRQGLYATEEERAELQRKSPVSDYDYNEEHAVDQLNMYFEDDVHTYEIEFHSSSVIKVKLPKLNSRNEYTKGEVTIFGRLENLIMREIL